LPPRGSVCGGPPRREEKKGKEKGEKEKEKGRGKRKNWIGINDTVPYVVFSFSFLQFLPESWIVDKLTKFLAHSFSLENWTTIFI
jgi:hypothetical protein